MVLKDSDIATGLPNKREMEALVHTFLYRFTASHPNFNPIDGSAQRLVEASPIIDTGRIQDALPTQDATRELAASWLSELGSFEPMPEKHIKELLSGLSDLSIEEKDQLHWILASDTVGQWLGATESSLLYLSAETPPDELVNALSFSAATLALTLAGASDMPVLSFFCGLRRNDSRDNSISGPKALRKSLNGQLLKFILDRRPDAELAFFQDQSLMERSRSRSKYAKKLFHELLGALPEDNIVYIILDSFSRLGGMPGDRDMSDDIIKEMAALKSEFPDLVMKILVVDAMPDCPVVSLADLPLEVPDEVDGWKNDVDLNLLDQGNRDAIKQLSKRRAKGKSRDEESSDFSSGSESD